VRLLGSSPPSFPRHFWRSERVLPSAVPGELAPTGSSSHKLPRLFRVLLSSNPSGTSQPRPSFHGVASFLFATSASSILVANLPRFVTFPSSAFLTPPTVCAATGLVGLFHPTATSRFPLFRGFPSRIGACLVDIPCPHVVSLRSLPAVAHQRHVPRPRPQGLTMRESVAFELRS